MKEIFLIGIIFFLSAGNVFAESITNPVVKISTKNENIFDTYSENSFTGFFIDHKGQILTTADNIMYDSDQYLYNDIIVCPLKTEENTTQDCRFKEDNTPEAEVKAILPSLNLALLQLSETSDLEFDFNSPTFVDYTPEAKEELTFKGFGYERYEFTNQIREPNDNSLTSMEESPFSEVIGKIVIKKFLDEDVNWYFLTDAAMNLGNSGSPVYSNEGALIGLTSAYGNGDDNNYYLIPPSTKNSVSYVISSDSILFFFLAMEDAEIVDMEFIETLFSEEQIEKIKAADEQIDTNLFDDLDFLSPYYQAISYLKENDIIGGYMDGTFKPDNPLNRAELLKILVEAGGNDPSAENYNSCFPDVKTDWYARYICFAYEQGWISGYADGTFKPENSVNKAEAIKMLMNIFDLYESRNEDWGGFDGHPFLDVEVGAWYMQYIGQAKELGILEETDGYFYPGNNITRGQISEVIYRLLILLISTGA